jgi:hypothetical protein
LLLVQARNILHPQEYQSFKKALDRIPPPGRPHRNVAPGAVAFRPLPAARYQPGPWLAHRPHPSPSLAHSSPSLAHRANVAQPHQPMANQWARARAQRAVPTQLAARQRSSGVRNIPPPPAQPGEPNPLPVSAVAPRPVAVPDAPTLVVPVAALLPDQQPVTGQRR